MEDRRTNLQVAAKLVDKIPFYPIDKSLPQCIELWGHCDVANATNANASDLSYQSFMEWFTKRGKVLREAERLVKLNGNVNITEIYELLEYVENDGSTIVMIMEKAVNGNLEERQKTTRGRTFPELEIEVKSYSRQLLSGLKSCHQNNIVHQDIKPDNILFFENMDGSETLKLADFGMSSMLNSAEERLRSYGGNKYLSVFMVPEVHEYNRNLIDSFDGEKADMYQVGLTLHYFIYGGGFQYDNERIFEREYLTYLATDSSSTSPDRMWTFHEAVMMESITYPIQLRIRRKNEVIHGNFLNFLVLLLLVNPDLRPSAEEMLTHPWLAEVTEEEEEDPSVPQSQSVQSLELDQKNGMEVQMKDEARGGGGGADESRQQEQRVQCITPAVSEPEVILREHSSRLSSRPNDTVCKSLLRTLAYDALIRNRQIV